MLATDTYEDLGFVPDDHSDIGFVPDAPKKSNIYDEIFDTLVDYGSHQPDSIRPLVNTTSVIPEGSLTSGVRQYDEKGNFIPSDFEKLVRPLATPQNVIITAATAGGGPLAKAAQLAFGAEGAKGIYDAANVLVDPDASEDAKRDAKLSLFPNLLMAGAGVHGGAEMIGEARANASKPTTTETPNAPQTIEKQESVSEQPQGTDEGGTQQSSELGNQLPRQAQPETQGITPNETDTTTTATPSETVDQTTDQTPTKTAKGEGVGEVAEKLPVAQAETPPIVEHEENPPAYPQVPTPENFNSIDDFLKFKQQRIDEEKGIYKREIGLTDEEADRLQRIMSRDGSTVKLEKDIGPEKAQKLNDFFDGPYNQKSNPNSFKFWDYDKNYNPQELADETDKGYIATSLINALQKGVEENPESDRFVYAAYAARRLKELGATKSDIARALDAYTTRNSGSQGDKAFLFKDVGAKVNQFLARQGLDFNQGDLGGKLPTPKAEPKQIEQPLVDRTVNNPEVAPSGGVPYGIAERVRDDRTKAGVAAPVDAGVGIDPEQSVVQGRADLAAGVDPEKAMSEFEKSKRFNQTDVGLFRAYGEKLAKQAGDARRKFGRASEEYKGALAKSDAWEVRSKAVQTEWAASGHAQQGETDLDTGSFTALSREYKKSTGKDFTPKQAIEGEKVADLSAKGDVEAAAAKKRLYDAADTLPVDPKVKSIADRIVGALDKTAAAALERIKARRAEGRLSAGLDPTDLADHAIYGASKIAKGLVDFSRWSADMVKDLGDYVKPHLKDIWEASNKQLDDTVEKGTNPENREAVKSSVRKTGLSPEQIKATMADYKSGKPFTPEQQKALWGQAKIYINEGEDDFDTIRTKMATDLGLSVDDVTRGLTQNAVTKRLADDVWKKQRDARRLKQQARIWVASQSTPKLQAALKAIPSGLFSIATAGHGTVALGTHAPAVFFQPPQWSNFFRNFGKMYKLVGSEAFYERQIQDLQRRPNYITARRAGLVNDPFQYEEYSSPEFVNAMRRLFPKTANRIDFVTHAGNRGYSVLKLLRQDMFDQQWNRLPETAQTPEVAKAIADATNHTTGVVKANAPKVANLAFFAPRLEASRAAWLVADPLRAANTLAFWNKATPAEQHFAIHQLKEKAWVMGTLLGLLSANQGFLSAAGSKQKINFTDPTESDWMKFKAFGSDFAFGNALLSMARFPANIYVDVKNEGKLNKIKYEDENVATTIFRYGRTQLSPAASIVADTGLGRDFQQRPLPRKLFGILPGDVNLTKRLKAQGVKPYTWTEYASQSGPIISREALKEVWSKGFGMNEEQQDAALKAFIMTAITGGTGGRISDDYNFNAVDKSKAKPDTSLTIQPFAR